MHKTASSASLVLEICHQFNNPFLNQFSFIFGGNCINFRTYKHDVIPETPDYEKFRPYFGWVNVDTSQKTMEQSTQWGVSLPNTFPMKKHLKSRNPALNIPRRHEAVATDTVFSDTPAEDSSVKQVQVFIGRDTLVADAYPMKSGKQFVNTLEDNIRRRGAMDKFLSDFAKTEISNKVMDILRAYHISNWHSEPYHQNQNPAEWRYRTIKSWTNTVMNRSGAPVNCWLLCHVNFIIQPCVLFNVQLYLYLYFFLGEIRVSLSSPCCLYDVFTKVI